jgi:putative ABC transport system ATP-binding protein/lipoprotein-releasing system ATP-binding protein
MLSVEGLGFSYASGSEELFDGLTHTFAQGKVTAVTGPSGRGKSTLLYVLGLMLRPTRGKVSLSGRSISDLPDADRAWLRARSLGFVFQDAALDPTRPVIDSVVEPALYGAGDDVRREAGLVRCSTLSVSRSGRTTGPERSLAARRSGSRWRARWSTTRP